MGHCVSDADAERLAVALTVAVSDAVAGDAVGRAVCVQEPEGRDGEPLRTEERVGEGEREAVGVGEVRVGVRVCPEGLTVRVAQGLGERVPLAVVEPEVAERVRDCEGEARRVREAVRVAGPLWVGVREGDAERVAERASVAEVVGDGALPVRVREQVPVLHVRVRDWEPEGLKVAAGRRVALRVRVKVGLSAALPVGLGVRDREGVGVARAVGAALSVPVAVRVRVAGGEAETVGEGEADAVELVEREAEGERHALAVALPLRLCVALGVGLWERDQDRDGEGLRLRVPSREGVGGRDRVWVAEAVEAVKDRVCVPFREAEGVAVPEYVRDRERGKDGDGDGVNEGL